MNIRVSDIKQYFYCPRVVYHTYYTPVTRPTTHPMQIGAVQHEVLSVLERRRTLSRYGLDAGSRKLHIALHAESLGLSGVLDLLIQTEDGAFPVEFKSTTQRLNLNAKYQLTAYALMVEECLGQIGFSGVYLSDPHTAHHASSDFRDTSAQDPSSDRADTEYAIRRVDATTDATARKMRRMRISSILCRCVVRISQIEFLRKRWGNLRKGVTIIDPVKRGLKKSRAYHHSNPNGDNSPACSRAIHRPYCESTLPNRSGDYRRLDLRPILP